MKRPHASAINTALLVIMGGLVGYMLYQQLHDKPIVVDPPPTTEINTVRSGADTIELDYDAVNSVMSRYLQNQSKSYDELIAEIKRLENILKREDSVIVPNDDAYLLLESIRRISAVEPTEQGVQ